MGSSVEVWEFSRTPDASIDWVLQDSTREIFGAIHSKREFLAVRQIETSLPESEEKNLHENGTKTTNKQEETPQNKANCYKSL